MSRPTDKSEEQLQAARLQYGETVSFRLRSDAEHYPDQARALEIIRGVNKYNRVEFFTQAILAAEGQKVGNETAETVAELRGMVNELNGLLKEAFDLVGKLSHGRFVPGEDRIEEMKLSPEFIAKMKQQERPSRVMRPPSDDVEE